MLCAVYYAFLMFFDSTHRKRALANRFINTNWNGHIPVRHGAHNKNNRKTENKNNKSHAKNQFIAFHFRKNKNRVDSVTLLLLLLLMLMLMGFFLAALAFAVVWHWYADTIHYKNTLFFLVLFLVISFLFSFSCGMNDKTESIYFISRNSSYREFGSN